MKRKLTVLLLALPLILAGCSSPEGDHRSYVKNAHYCTAETAQTRANFILSCIENANPRSDEEPEDWITKCKFMAEETLCQETQLRITEQCGAGNALFGCAYWRETKKVPVGG